MFWRYCLIWLPLYDSFSWTNAWTLKKLKRNYFYLSDPLSLLFKRFYSTAQCGQQSKNRITKKIKKNFVSWTTHGLSDNFTEMFLVWPSTSISQSVLSHCKICPKPQVSGIGPSGSLVFKSSPLFFFKKTFSKTWPIHYVTDFVNVMIEDIQRKCVFNGKNAHTNSQYTLRD